jgi:predicted ATPase/DNA-binding CsgD family transcriptional regulator
MAEETPAVRRRTHPVELVPLPERGRPPVSLPVPLTSFVGRDREVAAVAAMLCRPEVRLVSLTGPGGVGKTRLAVAAAAAVADAFDHGVGFVPLGSFTDPSLVRSSIAQALGVRETSDQNLRERMIDFLRDRALLLVLDNFEQVVAAAPELPALLGACPRLKVLVTSRAVLRVSGEHVFPVPPLDIPAPNEVPTADHAAGYAAVGLFVARAQAAKPEFALDEANAPAIAAICRHLDGLPLAIELAAARVTLLPPKALLGHLQHRLSILAGGARDQPRRLQTMRDAIAWSFDLLTPEEQRLFCRLGVFVGGCTLAAAQVVADAHGDLGLDVLDGIGSLIDKSLLREEEGRDGEPRYVMLDTVREYAQEQLATAGDVETSRRHMAWYVDLTGGAETGLTGPEQAPWLYRLDAEHGNIRAVLAKQAAVGDADGVLRLGRTIYLFWYIRGHLNEGLSWIERGLHRASDVSARVRGRALTVACLLAFGLDDIPRSVQFAEASLSLSRTTDDGLAMAEALHMLGVIAGESGRLAEAARLLDEAVALCRERGLTWFAGVSLIRLGEVSVEQGDVERGIALLEEALALLSAIGNAWGIADALASLGAAERRRGDVAREASLLGQSLSHFAAIGDVWYVVHPLTRVAEMAGEIGEGEQAARLIGTVEARCRASGVLLRFAQPSSYERLIGSLREQLGTDAFASAMSEGNRWSLERAISEAEAIVSAIARDSASIRDATPSTDGETSSAAPAHGLTSREREVLRLLPLGLSNKEIGRALFITERTATTHLAHIFAKLGVHNRTEAVARAKDLGLV